MIRKRDRHADDEDEQYMVCARCGRNVTSDVARLSMLIPVLSALPGMEGVRGEFDRVDCLYSTAVDTYGDDHVVVQAIQRAIRQRTSRSPSYVPRPPPPIQEEPAAAAAVVAMEEVTTSRFALAHHG